jgi:hypothetical protein
MLDGEASEFIGVPGTVALDEGICIPDMVSGERTGEGGQEESQPSVERDQPHTWGSPGDWEDVQAKGETHKE